MPNRTTSRVANALILSAALASLLACGGNRTPEQAAAPGAQAGPPAGEAQAPADANPQTNAAAEQTPAAAPAPAVEPPPAQAPKPKPATKPKPSAGAVAEAPTPAPPPKPAPVEKTLAAGTEFAVELLDGASSKTSKVGDAVRAKVTQPVVIDGLTAVPAGAVIAGTVTEAIPLNKIGGQASLGLRFDSLEIPGGSSAPIVATLATKGKSETGKDAGTIAGATAGGALLGRLLSKNSKTKGTLIGAAVGAAAGTGIAASTKGQEVELPAGLALTVRLEAATQVTVQP
jgi:hypothetical protein